MPQVERRLKSYSKHKDKLFGDRNMRPCHYCGKVLTRKTATYDHKQALSQGGYNKTKNGVLACAQCNMEKGSMPVGEFIKLKRAQKENRK